MASLIPPIPNSVILKPTKSRSRRTKTGHKITLFEEHTRLAVCQTPPKTPTTCRNQDIARGLSFSDREPLGRKVWKAHRIQHQKSSATRWGTESRHSSRLHYMCSAVLASYAYSSRITSLIPVAPAPCTRAVTSPRSLAVTVVFRRSTTMPSA